MTTAHTPSRACYLRGCRAEACIEADRRYTKRLRVEHDRGHYRTTVATQARHHIERLMAAGWTQRQIAAASRVEAASVHQIYTTQKRTAKWRAAAILAIPVGPPPTDPRRVDATGSRRRLQALRVIGHRRRDLAAALRMTEDRVKHITGGATARVHADEATAIARLYRRLSTIPGPCKQTAGIARNKGWHGPLAWDDIDDPDCQPEEAAPFEAFPKFERDPDRKAEIAHLDSLGESVASIAKQLGNSEKYIRDQLTAIRRERVKAADLREAA
ncbi:hypothetical protein [Streptomyces pseudogriseolus]|uniref:hypothetical protein n=1 Tax=Streptomyces pseudogriseolus TaxID=36817 RepID=UPI003FA247B0